MPEFELQKLLTQLPDSKDGKMPAIDVDLANDLGHTLIEGGRAAIAALLASLRKIDDGSDWKSRFLLHMLAIHVGAPGHEPQKQAFTDSCLAELGGDYPDTVKAFAVTQLRLVAGSNDIPKILPLLDSADPHTADAAADTLVSVGTAAREPLNKALGSARGRAKDLIKHSLAQIPRAT
jgi:hypothetical protein